MTSEQTCPRCGLTEAAGAHCTRCLFRPAAAVQRALSWVPATRQRCLDCGTDEQRGSFCTFCRRKPQRVILHDHSAPGSSCPLGPYRNPGPARTARERRDALAFNRRQLVRLVAAAV